MSRPLAAVLLVATALRVAGVLLSDRTVADVLRYQKVADHVLDVSWDPYQAPRLFPYPPVWIWFEVAGRWLSRHTGLSFAVLVKLPVVAADVGIVAWLARWGRRTGAGLRPAWLYALHPVAILVSAFHGQFEAMAILFVLLALSSDEAARRDRSALCLAAAIGLKSLPILLLPLFLLEGTRRARARFAALAVLPVLAILVPFAVHDAPALRRELFGYGGVADFGWIGLWRGLRWLSTGALPRSEAAYWPTAVTVAKLAFLGVYALLIAALATGRLRWTRLQATLAVFLTFLAFYGALSAQYLVWVAPFGVVLPGGLALLHAACSTIALLGFYPFLAEGVLWPAGFLTSFSGWRAGAVWVLGVAGVFITGLAWLAMLVRRGRRG